MRVVVALALLAGCRFGFEARDRASTDGGTVATDAQEVGDAVASDARVPDSSVTGWQSLSPIGYDPFDGNATDLAFAGGAITCTGCTFVAGHRGMGAVVPTFRTVPDRTTAGPNFTVAMWINAPTNFAGGFSACGTLITADTSLEAQESPPRLALYGINNNLPITTSAPITTDVWTHVAMTVVASSRVQTLFINGAATGTATGSMRADSLTGSRLAGGDCGVAVDELFLFDRVLSASDIVAVRDL